VQARMAKRARIVLLEAEGMTNRDIAAVVDLHYDQGHVADPLRPTWAGRRRG
jgi:transposase